MTNPEIVEEKRHGRWQRLWQQRNKWYLLYMPAGALLMFAAGIIFWGGFNTVLEATNTEEFCISCHEMKENVYEEYKQTIHYKNPAGVRAICSDCHVPRPWVHKMIRKIRASNEILHKIMGTIDTREKFLSHREELAQRVWDTMKSTDSRECRNCHAQSFMNLEKQDRIAQRKHAAMLEDGKTCIDCHKGIAHKLPGSSAKDGG
jgi:nitrate/TMAO reductase-like tetraheme cytochrome c subunit